MKLYFFGNDDCETCQLMLAILDKEGIQESFEFIFIDALSKEQQLFCDKHEVDEIPHVKLVDNNDELIFERIGIFDPSALNEFLDESDIKHLEKEDIIDDYDDFVYDEDEDRVPDIDESYFNIRYFRSDKE